MSYINSVPVRYKDAVIKKDDDTGWQPAIYETAAQFLSGYWQYRDEGKAPFFSGRGNTGKTYAAAAIVNYLSDKVPERTAEDFTFVWAPVCEIFNVLAAHRDYRKDQFWMLHKAILMSDLVVFDDFGYLTDYPRHKEMFWTYVNARHDAKRQTIFTCQYDLSDGWDSLIELEGEGMARRMMVMCQGLMAVAL